MNLHAETELSPVEHVVAVGASAGGLEALEALFDHLAPSTGAAFVVITHLSPDFKSIMDELLARRTAMPVHVVEDGASLAANNVYVIPPGKDMIVQAGRLFLSDRQGHGAPAAPIDLFFGSLASAFGRRATGVVLSGTGKDGSQGARALREAGGYVLAQSAETARFDGMPRAVADSGGADAVLAPEDIGATVVARIARIEAEDGAPNAVDGGESASVGRLLEIVLGGANVDFSEYKRTTILRRMARRMQTVGVATMPDYIERLRSDPAEVRALADDLLIVVTEFFRDREAFDLLAEGVAPELVDAAQEDRPIRVWVPAVGTGQEAYSIAMILAEAIEAAGRETRVQIFATDISPSALERAAAGVYSEAEMAAVSAERREKYFVRTEDGAWQIGPDLRGWIVFAQHNMLRDPPFINTNLISCRNALIYLEPSAQNKALSLFHFSLSPGGHLLLGPSESVNDDGARFAPVDAKWRLFRKRAADRRDAAAMGELIAGARPIATPGRPRGAAPQAGRGLNAGALQQLVELFAPAGLLIGRDRELLHVVGDARAHLAPPAAGPFTRDASKLVRTDLRAALSTAVERCVREGEPLAFAAGEGAGAATLTAHPLAGPDGVVEKVFVAFGPPPDAPATAEAAPYDKISEQRIAYLEDALRQERENLQSMLEQLETSNEELQSTNEELMTANEELQSTNEELHSVNEELYTVNAEYERKNEELTQLSKDVSSLLQATGVGVVFVARDLEVRRFTATATRVVNLMAGDEGRRLDHVTHTLPDFDLVGWLRAAMAQDDVVEVERRGADGAVWMLRAAPVRDGRTVSGAVLSMVDVTRVAAAEGRARAQQAELEALLLWVGAVSLRLDGAGAVAAASGDWAALTGVDVASQAATVEDAWAAVFHPEDAAALRAQWAAASSARARAEFSGRLRRPDGGWRPVALAAVPTRDGAAVVGWRLYVCDEAVAAAARRDAGVEFARAEALASLAFAGAYAVDVAADAVTPDARLARLLDLAADGAPAARFEARLTPESRMARRAAMAAVAKRGDVWSAEVSVRLADGDLARMRDVGAVLEDGPDGAPARLVGALRRLDEEEAEAALAREIVRASPVEVTVIDAEDFSIRDANLSAQRAFGLDLRALQGLDYTALLPEFDRDGFAAVVAPLRRGAAAEVALETFALRRDGETYDLSLTLRAMAGGARLAAVGRDATARRRADETLRRRNEALARARRDLEDFALAAGHDLIAPLGALADDAAAAAEAAPDGRLSAIAARARRLQRQLRDLLAYARSDPGGEGARPIDLTAAAVAARAACASAVEAAGAAVEIAPLPRALGAPKPVELALKAALEHLLARPAAGAARLTLAPAPPDGPFAEQPELQAVTLRDARPLRAAAMSDAEAAERALGLTLCRRIVEADGGAMRLVEDDAGAALTIALPAAPALR